MKSILCIGDSNTYGVNPENNGRFDWNERWTGRLQTLLGDNYRIVEEGYNGRTTCFSDASDPFRSASYVLDVILKTHMPVDMVILMLGTNDFKTQFSMTAKVSGYGVKKIVDRIGRFSRAENRLCPKILIVSPIMMGEKISESRFWEYDDNSRRELEKLPSVLKEVSKLTETAFFDASTVAGPGSDQLHMTKESHARLAESLAQIVKALIQETKRKSPEVRS